jgi:hypothetical protein
MELKRYEVEPLDRYNAVTDKKYRMNTLLKLQLDLMSNVVEYDSDMVMLIDGEIEGTGKSTLAQQIAYYFAWKAKTKFSVDNIIFNPTQLKNALENAEKFSVFIWDEAYEGSNKYRIMSSENQKLTTIFQKIRQKNLFLIIVLPSFFDLSKYYAVRRSWALIHCYLQPQVTSDEADEGDKLDLDKPVLQKGFFKYFTRPLKKKLYNWHKKDEDYSTTAPRFIGMFPPFYTVDEQEYKLKKSKIEADEGIDEKEWVRECLRRGMEVSEIAPHSKYGKRNIFLIKESYDKKEAESVE